MQGIASRKRQLRRVVTAMAGLSVIVGGVAHAAATTDIIPSFFAAQENASLAMIVDPSVFGLLGAVGFFALATVRRNRT